MVCCCLMASASIGFFTNAYGVFYTPLSEALNVGRGEIAIHATIAGLVTGLSGPFVVKLLGRVKLQFMIGIGTVLLVLSTIATTFADRIWQLNMIGIFRGMGCACYYVPVITIILGNWFHKYYSTVSGITLSFSGIAGAILSPCLSGMITSLGYQETLLYSAVFILLLSLPGFIFCRMYPEDVGMRALGAEEKETEKKAADISGEKETETAVYQPVVSSAFVLLSIVGFLSLSIIGLTQHFSGYTESIGLGTAAGVAMMSAIMIGNIITKLLIGIISDAIGSIPATMSFLAIAVAAVIVLFFQPENIVILLAAAFAIGTVYAVGSVGLAGVAREVFGKERYGGIFAVVTALTCVSSSLALTAIGYIYDLTGGYRPAIGGAVICGIISMAGLQILKRITARSSVKENKIREKPNEKYAETA